MNIVEAKNISKKFGETIAVDNVSLELMEGYIYGLIGPNGAGKTTTLRILTGLIEPDTGEVLIKGKKINLYSVDIKKMIGIVPQTVDALEVFLTVRDNLQIYGHIRNIDGIEIPNRIREISEIFQLQDVLDRPVDLLSIGMKRRVQIARVFMDEPKLVFLDEPTVGLDPISKRILWAFIRDYAKRGNTVLLTSHSMAEVEYLCDYIFVIKKGKIILEGEPKKLLSEIEAALVVEIEIVNADEEIIRTVVDTLSRKDVFIDIQYAGNIFVYLKSLEGVDMIREVVEDIVEPGMYRLITREKRLEDLYIKVVGGGDDE